MCGNYCSGKYTVTTMDGVHQVHTGGRYTAWFIYCLSCKVWHVGLAGKIESRTAVGYLSALTHALELAGIIPP